MNVFTISYAKLAVDMGNSALSSGIYTFPDLYISGSSDDKGYLIRFGFSGATVPSDAISLPALPSGWSEVTGSTAQERIITIPSGATTAELQDFLRLMQITVASATAGQEVTVWIGEDSWVENRNVHYFPDNGHWYEYVGSAIPWADAYNAALDKIFSGLSGYLVTITSQNENNFVHSIISGNSWFAGTRMDIREVLNPVTGKLTGIPTTSLDYWYWTAGPEWVGNGKNPEKCVFYNQKTVSDPPEPVTGIYPNFWASGEPNDWSGVEAFGYYDLSTGGGTWSDVNGAGSQNYIVEYDGTMQGVSAKGIIAGASIKTASISGTVNNGKPATPVLLNDGEMITYTITAANLSVSSSAVIVRDTVPEGLEVITGSITDNGDYDPSTREIVWVLSIPPGGNLMISFEAEKITGATHLMTNTAYVISDGTTVKSTNNTYHTGEAKLKRISYQYMACPGSDVELGFFPQEGVSFEWFDDETGGFPTSAGNDTVITKDNSAVQTWYVEVTYDGTILPERIPVNLNLAANCGSITPQGCAIDGTLLFQEDFGGNNVSDPTDGPPLDANLITYSYRSETSVPEGAYIITKKSKPALTPVWYEVDDHTHPGDFTRGYMLQVNAAQEPGQFYSFRIDGLESRSTLYFSTWIMSVLNYPGSHPTNMIFILEDGNDVVIAKYYTGDIPDADLAWKQYGFEFDIPDGQTSLVLKIVNNGAGSSGNDFVMDDIEVRLCAPESYIIRPVASDSLLCASNNIELIGTYTDRDNIFGTNLRYRWEWSATGNISNPGDWSVVSGADISGVSGTSGTGNITSKLSINNIQPEHNLYYRFVVATPNNIDDYYKRSMSRVIHLTVNPAFAAGSLNGTDTVCPGVIPDPIYGTLPTGGSGAYTYQWQQRTDDSNWTDIPGAIGMDFTPDTLKASTYFRRIDTDILCGSAETNSHFIELQARPVILIQPMDEECFEEKHQLTVVALGKHLSYQWYRYDRKIEGATRSTYTATQIGKYHVIVSTPCGDEVKSYVCEVSYCDKAEYEIQRKVIILPAEHIRTNPLAGLITYVKGHKDFNFTMKADPGYSLENIVVTTGIDHYDKSGIRYNHISDDSVEVTIRQITHVLTITISNTSPTVNEYISYPYKTWAYNERLYFNIPQPAKVWIYTLTGALYANLTLPAGDYSMPVKSGFYIIVFDNGIRYKVSVSPR